MEYKKSHARASDMAFQVMFYYYTSLDRTALSFMNTASEACVSV